MALGAGAKVEEKMKMGLTEEDRTASLAPEEQDEAALGFSGLRKVIGEERAQDDRASGEET